MPVDAIGGVVGPKDAAETLKNTINQEQFFRLFLTQLRFQDPTEPVDNREFLAQMAQFTALQQTRQISENTSDLLTMNSNSQAVSLLNRQVQVGNPGGVPIVGTVKAVIFDANGTLLSVTSTDGSVFNDVRLSQITLVRP